MPKKKKSENQNGNVQTVESKTQKPEIKTGLKLPSQSEIMKNPMKYIGQAVQTFQNLAVQVEEQGKAIIAIAKHVESSDEKLAPIVNALEQAQAARQQPQVTGAPNTMPQGDIFSILQMLPGLLGGGGVDEEMRALNKRMMEMSLSRMQADIGFTEAIKTAIVTKLAGKAASDLAI